MLPLGLGNQHTIGRMVSATEAMQPASEVAAILSSVDRAVHDWGRAAERWYLWRNRSLLLGFVLLITSRVMAAYGL